MSYLLSRIARCGTRNGNCLLRWYIALSFVSRASVRQNETLPQVVEGSIYEERSCYHLGSWMAHHLLGSAHTSCFANHSLTPLIGRKLPSARQQQ